MSLRFRSTAWSASLWTYGVKTSRGQITRRYVPCRIHHRGKVGDASTELTMDVLLPSYGTRFLGRGGGPARALLHNSKATLPASGRARWGNVVIAPAKDAEAMRGVIGIKSAEVSEQITKGPARVGGHGGGVDEADGTLRRRNVGEEGWIVLDGAGCCLSGRGTYKEKGAGRDMELGLDGGELERVGLRGHG